MRMQSRAQRCRERARDCEYLADAVRNPSLRSLLRETAQLWREMAEHAELLDRLSVTARVA